MSSGSTFHAEGPACEKAGSPIWSVGNAVRSTEFLLIFEDVKY